jgi:hypothetical protein
VALSAKRSAEKAVPAVDAPAEPVADDDDDDDDGALLLLYYYFQALS